MLTLRQVLSAAGSAATGSLSTRILHAQFASRPLSVRAAIAAYEKQTRAVFCRLISPNILKNPAARTVEDVARLAEAGDGNMNLDEVKALVATLERNNIYLRYVTADLRSGALVGSVASMANMPTARLDAANMLQLEDKASGVANVGGALVGVGGAFLGLSTVPEPGSPVLVAVGISLLVVGAGLYLGAGIFQLIEDEPPSGTSVQKEGGSSSNDAAQPGADDDGSADIPGALVFGAPPDGVDAGGVAQTLADLTVDLGLADIPAGWNPGSGASTSVLGDFGDSADGDFGDGFG